MKKIVIECIEPGEARLSVYAEKMSGDWWRENGTLHIRVVSTELDNESLCVAVHELVEAALCASAGVTQADVDAFDAQFAGDGEPGDSPEAPYRTQHRKALLLEFLLADMLGLMPYGRME
jgi:hypothetical protein